MDVEAVAAPLADDVLDERFLHVDEIDTGGELADRAVPDGYVHVAAGAYADAVELWLRPGLRAHPRAGDRLAAEVEGHVVRVDHERVPVAPQVVREDEVRGDPLTALRAL